MTNVYSTPEKVLTKTKLFDIGVETLRKGGWTVERIAKAGKASLRRITKGKDSRVVSIRTTQDTWIAFPRDKTDTEWVTLSEVDAVVAVSVNDKENPRFAQVHMIDGDDMRDRFDRAYTERRKAGYQIPVGRGVWVSLYLPEGNDPVTHVGAGAGRDNPPLARIPLDAFTPEPQTVVSHVETESDEDEEAPLTIGEAKRRLALNFGVDPANVKITIEA